jgi:Tfp pilus assembly protein PilF
VIIYKPDIISAQLYFVQQEIKSEQFEKAELSVKDFINRNPAWFLYMKLAEIYFSQQKYNMAKSVIEEQCQKLNPHNFRQYLLLGDIYASQGDKVLAKEKYLEAGRLNPDDTSFREKIMGLE